MPKEVHSEIWGAGVSTQGDDAENECSDTVFVAEFSIEPEKQRPDPAAHLAPLFEAKREFQRLDMTSDSRLSRDELIFGTQSQLTGRPGIAELHLIENFAQLSGGTGSITKVDIDRAIMGNLTKAIEDSDSTLSFDVRSGITRWADSSGDKKTIDLQNQFNTALSGSGKQIKIEKSNFINYLVEGVPVTTFTILEGSKTQDKFSTVRTSDARHSLIEGRSTRGWSTIIEDANPRKVDDPRLTENMANLRALQHLMKDPIITKKGEISFEDMTNYKSDSQEQKYTKIFLQYNFGELAMKDRKNLSVSPEDLRIKMEESVSSLIANSLMPNKRQSDELVDSFIKTALQDEYVGLSDTFSKTLNAALEKQGYSATISEKSDKVKTITGEHIRTLSIENSSNHQKSKVLNFLTRDPSLFYQGYEKRASAFK